MELLVKNIRSKSERKLLTDFLKRLGLSYKELTLSEKEDISFGIAIEQGKKSGLADEKEVMNVLQYKTPVSFYRNRG